MNKIIIFTLLIWLIGCSSRGNVAITQTGNPSQVALVFTVGSSSDTNSSIIIRKSREESLIRLINITSAKLLVNHIVVLGDSDSAVFDRVSPYLIDIALDSNGIVVDSFEGEIGNKYDSLSFLISSINDTENSLNGNSIAITGFLNGDSSNTFLFESNISVDKSVVLVNPLIVSGSLSNNILTNFDISKWFIDDEGKLIDPNNKEAQEEIENAILGSISGDEHHDEKSSDDDEEISSSEEVE